MYSFNSSQLQQSSTRFQLKRLPLLAACVVVGVGFVLTGFFSRGYYVSAQGSSAQSVAEDFMGEIAKGEFEKAYTLTTSNLKTQIDINRFKEELANMQTDNLTTEKVDKYQTDQGYYYVQHVDGLPRLGERTDARVNLLLVKEDGQWRVTTAYVT